MPSVSPNAERNCASILARTPDRRALALAITSASWRCTSRRPSTTDRPIPIRAKPTGSRRLRVVRRFFGRTRLSSRARVLVLIGPLFASDYCFIGALGAMLSEAGFF
ncbi:hypothetical protein D3C79_763230 [compost metagenome]